MTKVKVRNGFLIGITLIILGIGLYISTGTSWLQAVSAAKNDSEIVDLRIIGTTDLHGQLNSRDYELGVDYNNGGLARVYDLIKKTRAELPNNNTIMLDNGDILYDYTTEYIFSSDQEAIQPILQAIKYMGYDAITLGNHEFDYGYDYLLHQLDGSGLMDITVVSNLTDAKTGKHPFLEDMIITRKAKTRSGKEVEIKIGIIGQTIPNLTSKTHSYVGILTGEDMVENARKQAAKLKEKGADVIIALSHTGIGPENPELNFKNVAYALTKIPDIDVVIAGHEHNLYPTTDMSSPYYKLPNVDKKTYLMNGKNVVMAGDRGKAIGVVDLALEIKGDDVNIINRKSTLRMVTEKNTVEDTAIAQMFGSWEEQLNQYASEVLAELEPGTELQNYFGLLRDNAAIQLLNDSKIHYAITNVKANEKKYIDYPIIAASTYESYGVKSINDFVSITDRITEADLSTLQNYNSYLYVYTITGSQLKEWLEWSASAYETINGDTQWKDATMSDLMKETGLKSLIREEWLNDWSNFYVFDGISYDIDPSVDPRYDFSGNRISSNKRVSNVRYQGKAITNDMILLIATNKITKPTGANKGVENQAVLKGFVRSQTVLGKYIRQLSESGSIVPQVDNNWKLILPRNYQFIVKVPYYTKELFESTRYFVKQLKQRNQYLYYAASYPGESGDTTAPHLVIAPLVTNPTASTYEVMVQAVDESEIKALKCYYGEMDINCTAWAILDNIPNRGFTAYTNGIYTIYAEDIHGNKTIKSLNIDNFRDNLLPKPTVDNYTNRKQKISGKAEPNTILVIETPNKKYEQRVSIKGTFSVELPGQLADTYITVYVKDEARGLESEHVSVKVNRTGPNQPTVNPLNNNEGVLTGNTRDTVSSVIAIVGNVVYVSDKGGKELFEANKEIYDPKYTIVETTVNIAKNKKFTIMLPPQLTGKTVKVYTLDHVSRNSRVSSVKVQKAAPEAPVVNEITNIERTITGRVPSGANLDLQLHLEGQTFTTKTDKSGYFTYTFDSQLYAGQIIRVMAYDVKKGKERYSYPTAVTVNDIELYDKPNSTNLVLNRVTDKSYLISGFYYGGGNVNLAIATGEGRDFKSELYSVPTDKNFGFIYRLKDKLQAGTKVYVMVRFVNGRILLARSLTVVAGRPDTPKVLKEVTNTDTEVKVVAIKDCLITLKIGDKEYTTEEYIYDEAGKQYIYTLTIDKEKAGTSASITATNSSGTSDPLKIKIGKAASGR